MEAFRMSSLAANRSVLLLLVVVVLASTTGCAAIQGIFKAGFWVGVILTVLVIGGGLFLVTRFRG
jgi:hypothetical protein